MTQKFPEEVEIETSLVFELEELTSKQLDWCIEKELVLERPKEFCGLFGLSPFYVRIDPEYKQEFLKIWKN